MGNCCKKKKNGELLTDLEKQELVNSKSPSISSSSQKINITSDDFELLKQIGRGSLGEVLLVKYKLNNKLYAMKILSKSTIKEKGQEIHTQTERDLMVQINNPFIVNIKFAFQNESKLFLVQEFVQGGDLYFHLQESGKFTNERVKFYITELVLAIIFLHKKNMIYRDLKPENILLDKNGHIKLTDFGISKLLLSSSEKAYTICGTSSYLAPEIMEGKGYNKPVDWWSLGCVMFEMLTGRYPYKVPDNNFGYFEPKVVFSKKIKFPKNFDDVTKDLLLKLLEINPDKRIGDDDIKNHQYFSDVNWDDVMNKKVNPPFVPELNDDMDLKYFEKSFTDEVVDENKVGSYFNQYYGSNTEYKDFSYVAGSSFSEMGNLDGKDVKDEEEA